MKLTKNLFSALFNDVPIGILVVDENTNIVKANEYLFKIFNCFPDSYQGKKFGNTFGCAYVLQDGSICGTTERCSNCDIRNGVLSVLRDDVKIKDAVVSHDFLVHGKSVKKRLRINAFPISDQEQKNVIITIVDITDTKALERLLHENEVKYKLLFDNMSQGFALHEIITDAQGKAIDYRFLDINSAFEIITGLKKEIVIGQTVKQILPHTEQYWIDVYGKVALTGNPCQIENFSVELDKYFDVWVFCPQLGRFATIISDITTRIKMKNDLAESELKFKRYYDNAPDGIFVVDKTGRYINANIAACTMTGYCKEELLNMNIMDITPSDYHDKSAIGFENLLKKGEMNLELPYLTKDKQVRIWTISAVKINENEFLGFSKDVTEKHEFEDKLKYAFYHDTMTGLYNRQYVFDHLESIDNDDNFPLTIICADINGLRSINESLGFVVGDEIIKKVAVAIKNTCDKCVSVRWGGDDFLVFLSNANEEDSKTFIQNVKTALQQELTDELQNVSISIGSFTKNDMNISLKKAIKNADESMVQNKISYSESIQNTPINMILHTLHEKNKREEMHSKRVSEICVAIGNALEMSKEDINKLRIIGLVHDIGKIGIDENILNKTAKLTNRECEIMKQHSEIGFRILSANKQTTELAFHILSHHERLDGAGYPNGIKGKDISMFTRILSIADSFDAMTRKRAYCEGMSTAAAVQELKRCAGTQFDTEIVNIFINKVLIDNPNFSWDKNFQ